jgi:hypothetical protein
MHGRGSPARDRPLIVTVGLDQGVGGHELRDFAVVEATSTEEARRLCAEQPVAVLVLGDRLTSADAHSILSLPRVASPHSTPISIVINADADLFQEFVDRDELFYLSRHSLNSAQLLSIVRAGAERFRRKHDPLSISSDIGLDRAERILDFAFQLSLQTDLPSAGRLTIEALLDVIGTDRAQCYVYDPNQNILCPAEYHDDLNHAESAASGLAGFVARTGERISLDTVSADPRYDPGLDDPHGSAGSRFIAEPITGAEDAILGVLTASRNESHPPFSREDSQIVNWLALCVAPAFSRMLLQGRLQVSLTSGVHNQEPGDNIFRREALDEHARGWDRQGQLIQSRPAWLMPTYWAMFAALAIVALLWVLLDVGRWSY